MFEKGKYREMFVEEAHEHVQNLNKHLLKLEEEPEASEHLDALFRSAHTLKGMAATMGYDQISQLSKIVEELLDKLRKGEVRISSNLADSLFRCFDALEEMVDDENKKTDLEPYLKKLQGPFETRTGGGSELLSPVQLKLPTIRVKTQDLDSLVDLVGQLVIAKMRLHQMIPEESSAELRQAFGILDGLVSEIQDQAMRVRLVPIDQVFNRFPRMVRDLATTQRKVVKLEMEGSGIEVDRTVLEAITEPLLHLLRNAVDHGIETPSERKKGGKTEAGTIRLVAARVGDRVAVHAEDDGRGIDLEKIRAMAIEKKIVRAEEARLMTDEEIFGLLGTPGLTGVKGVTDVSGRGVGLNVARTQVEGIGGYLKIESKKGSGTRVTITVPITLAIIGGLQIAVGEERYVLPLSSVRTVVEVSPQEIKTVHGREVIMLGGQVVPLTRLADALGARSRRDLAPADGKVAVVVVDKGGRSYGFVVDEVQRKQDVVIKRLDNSSRFSTTFPNATILPDGRVALILDSTLLF